MLNKLYENGSSLSTFEQLIFVTGIRRMISGSEEPPVREILQTSILSVISTIFKFSDTSEDIRIMKVTLFVNQNSLKVFGFSQIWLMARTVI